MKDELRINVTKEETNTTDQSEIEHIRIKHEIKPITTWADGGHKHIQTTTRMVNGQPIVTIEEPECRCHPKQQQLAEHKKQKKKTTITQTRNQGQLAIRTRYTDGYKHIDKPIVEQTIRGTTKRINVLTEQKANKQQ